MICLEPNPAFYQLARENCQPYLQVNIQNTSFEEWQIEPNQFDVVLSASAFHWIPPEISYPKAADALKEDGYLVLLWNKELQPNYEIYQSLSEIYQRYAPSLDRYEDRETQESILRGLGQIILDSGYFRDLISEHFLCEVTYSIDDYLLLLNTYSPYLKLEPPIKDSLFTELRHNLEKNWGETLELSYLSAFHIARKNKLVGI